MRIETTAMFLALCAMTLVAVLVTVLGLRRIGMMSVLVTIGVICYFVARAVIRWTR